MKIHFERKIFQLLQDKVYLESFNISSHILNIEFRHIIRWYPQISTDAKDTYGLDIIGRLSNWNISIRAANAIESKLRALGKEITWSQVNTALKEITHPEHNAPVDYIKNALIKSCKTDEKVQEILRNGYEVILLSKEEAIVLNGKEKYYYDLEGEKKYGLGLSKTGSAAERLKALDAKLISEKERMLLIEKIHLLKSRLKTNSKLDPSISVEDLQNNVRKIFKQIQI